DSSATAKSGVRASSPSSCTGPASAAKYRSTHAVANAARRTQTTRRAGCRGGIAAANAKLLFDLQVVPGNGVTPVARPNRRQVRAGRQLWRERHRLRPRGRNRDAAVCRPDDAGRRVAELYYQGSRSVEM